MIFSRSFCVPFFSMLAVKSATPKPWRCGISDLSVVYPWQDRAAEQRAKQWEQEYARNSARFATCLLLEQIGRPGADPEIAHVVKVHDEMTKTGSGLALA